MKRFIVTLFVAILFATTSQAAVVQTFSGIDPGMTAVGPNSLAARADFDAAASPADVITFEDLALTTFPTDPSTPFPVYSGVNVNYFGDVDPLPGYFGITDYVDPYSPSVLGFNTTEYPGEKYLGFVPLLNPVITPGMTWTFATPIKAWGAYITGLEPGVPGVLHLVFDDGSSQDLAVPDGSIGGGVQFFGFITDGSVIAIDLELLGVTNTRDIFGVDDVVFSEVETSINVPVDIKPGSCPNPLNVKSKGVVPVAILGTETFDVTQIDPATIHLAGVQARRWAFEDVSTPYESPISGPYDCSVAGADGYLDLTLKFKTQAIVAALGHVTDGQILLLDLTGNLKPEFGGTPIQGQDVMIILKKGK